MKYFIWVLRAFYYQVVWNFTKRKNVWILSRTACLFNDTYKLLGLNQNLRYNIQKGRVDLWISYFTNKLISPDLIFIEHILRKDIRQLFLQQIYFQLPKKNKPTLFVMDSFSELVDKKFVSKNNNKISLYAYFSDVDDSIFEKMHCDDLLPINEIYNSYKL